MSRTAIHVARPDRGNFVPADLPDRRTVVSAGRSKSGDFNFGLLAALPACLAFWALFALTVYWLI
jgi:hypothetical protein